MHVNQISGSIVEAAFKVHNVLGPGLLESAYEACLSHELKKLGLQVASQVSLPVKYDGIVIEAGYRIDMIVQESVIVELKAIEKLLPIHQAQLLTYLKVGLLINFNDVLLKHGIKRLVNNL